MKLFEDIKKVASKEAKYAFIDLACLMLFSEKKLTLAEQDFIKRVVALETHTTEMLEQRYENSMSKVKRRDFDSEAFMEGIARNLSSPELKSLAGQFVDQFFGNKVEQSLAIKIKSKLAS